LHHLNARHAYFIFVNERASSSAVHHINYHFVWCPKYRKKILVGDVAVFVQAQIRQIAIDEIIEYIMPDHVHLFESPTNIVKGFMQLKNAKQIVVSDLNDTN
ncbi:MAG: transposase, partial [Thermoproteota archaeon]